MPEIPEKGFEFVEHPSDFRVRAWGRSRADVFIESARGMAAYLFGDEILDKEEGLLSERLEIVGSCEEQLLVDWLSRLLFLSHAFRRAYVSFSIMECSNRVVSGLVGWVNAEMIEDIKGVTYHELVIVQSNDSWLATVTFDV